ncbi:MAG: CDP-diacylglycerol--glycerol-3-phosphate 3-phosphatidyltransferase [Alphaproteobacteria bacterium]|nr:MAG: CDP-diacylglycerol--glycerol-3-phosphate 3-phosphatidyltransferase [Alphaproteobacteria bacterium]TAF14328.1 MAG: CDP-diacylglycerol--glycerol-3-phosphate 3-phosphatidyltransferase [Alphaproteobacteria bacterium]TAF40325.1 MAG: CDP-diacylglycerol--glycerol-3-phosphate 3-phosphatidyltransferase [Alphaproteobacteria bacterium]TAF74736.1 MAG: CDP-diacylglycerol--glycerol-3-phosphate 3-phosphatidyltransferase [Alphaproteobacteria bacterium]
MSFHNFKQHIPNMLTISRILVIVPMCALLYGFESSTAYISALMLSLYAMVTDFFDGYLARKWNIRSDLGRMLDPIADKLLVAALLVLLSSEGLAHPLAVVLIMLRELFISGLRECMLQYNVVVHVTTLAKYKTASQMVACFILLVVGMMPEYDLLRDLGDAMLWIATLLTLVTGYDYCRQSFRFVLSHKSS